MTQMTWHCMTWAAALLTNSWAPPISLILWSPSIELKNAYYSLKKPHKHFCSFLKLNFAFMLVLSIPSTTSTLNYTSVGTKPTTGRRHGMDWTLTTAKKMSLPVLSGTLRGIRGFWRLVGRGEWRGRDCRGSTEVRDGLEGANYQTWIFKIEIKKNPTRFSPDSLSFQVMKRRWALGTW